MNKIEDKYKFTKDENKRFARANLARLVHTNSRFEGINTTLPQTKTIIDGMSVSGVSVEDVLTIVNLKRGWQFIINSNDDINLDFEKGINKIVAAEDSLEPGEFRTGAGNVALGEDESFEPPMINSYQEKDFLETTLKSTGLSTTEKALNIMYHNMRNQLFWDGNKRTAILVANKIMINGGAGLINVPLDKWSTWNTLISNYYRTNNMSKLKKWTYDNGIQGVETKEIKHSINKNINLNNNRGIQR